MMWGGDEASARWCAGRVVLLAVLVALLTTVAQPKNIHSIAVRGMEEGRRPQTRISDSSGEGMGAAVPHVTTRDRDEG